MYVKWLALDFLPKVLFFISTKFPTLDPSFRIVPGLILAYGPISTLFSTLQSSRWEKDFITTLFPILTFKPKNSSDYLGGAAAIANNISVFCKKVDFIIIYKYINITNKYQKKFYSSWKTYINKF